MNRKDVQAELEKSMIAYNAAARDLKRLEQEMKEKTEELHRRRGAVDSLTELLENDSD
ncbi:hypothetical protein [Spirochaeta africana]|uniref:Uncharacterized protein n=1 Tax=Spirochaeta africana (strain ATCC 700263 / DSM 8902 / Z-7692) TaxID=889378 RepID=H9UJD1_SPIAZ|nr:hypothetical protein [Spirochaeta africana]AFG37624.1 hypothetical protein Spiaf_1565 [Spirochaeta africana DSM 8902]